MSDLCEIVHELFLKSQRFSFPFNESCIPSNGIYILYEKGEIGHNTDRIVRIGTHTGDDQLRSRLKQHFLTENKDRSIFRKNIGRALLNKEKSSFLPQWDIDLTSRSSREKYGDKIDLRKQKEVEIKVSDYIQNSFSFIGIPVDQKTDRLTLESQLISIISLCKKCGSSDTWLGNYSPKKKIWESGLWQVNELHKAPLSAYYIDLLNKILNKK